MTSSDSVTNPHKVVRVWSYGTFSSTMGGTTLIYLNGHDIGSGSSRMAIRMNDGGRVVSISIDGKPVHDRKVKRGKQRGVRLPREKFRAVRDYACALVAMKALGHDLTTVPTLEVAL